MALFSEFEPSSQLLEIIGLYMRVCVRTCVHGDRKNKVAISVGQTANCRYNAIQRIHSGNPFDRFLVKENVSTPHVLRRRPAPGACLPPGARVHSRLSFDLPLIESRAACTQALTQPTRWRFETILVMRITGCVGALEAIVTQSHDGMCRGFGSSSQPESRRNV